MFKFDSLIKILKHGSGINALLRYILPLDVTPVYLPRTNEISNIFYQIIFASHYGKICVKLNPYEIGKMY